MKLLKAVSAAALLACIIGVRDMSMAERDLVLLHGFSTASQHNNIISPRTSGWL